MEGTHNARKRNLPAYPEARKKQKVNVAVHPRAKTQEATPFSVPSVRAKYRDLGKVPARGPARIYPMYPEDIEGIPQENARIFLRPKNPLMHSVRVKPSITEIHGLVYAVPAAPNQWVQIMNTFSIDADTDMHVDIFVEDLKQTNYLKRYRPYGTVTYVWKAQDLARPIQAPFAGSSPLLLSLMLYLACANMDEIPHHD